MFDVVVVVVIVIFFRFSLFHSSFGFSFYFIVACETCVSLASHIHNLSFSIHYYKFSIWIPFDENLYVYTVHVRSFTPPLSLSLLALYRCMQTFCSEIIWKLMSCAFSYIHIHVQIINVFLVRFANIRKVCTINHHWHKHLLVVRWTKCIKWKLTKKNLKSIHWNKWSCTAYCRERIIRYHRFSSFFNWVLVHLNDMVSSYLPFCVRTRSWSYQTLYVKPL